MIRNLQFLLFGLLFVSCSTNSKENSDATKSETIVHSSASNTAAWVDLQNKILGVWTSGNTENATFEIGKDSILYVDQLESYPYSLREDSISINYPDFTYLGKVEFVGDTLVLSSPEGITKYWRFRN